MASPKKEKIPQILVDVHNKKVVLHELPKRLKLVRAVGSAKQLEIFKASLEGSDLINFPAKIKKSLKKYEAAVTHTGIPPELQVCKISQQIGLGVFLKLGQKPIKRGEFIGIYTGQIEIHPHDVSTKDQSYAFELLSKIKLTDEQIKALRKKETKKKFTFYVNALKKGNFTSLINHTSNKQCNVKAYIYQHEGMAVPILVAKKKILPGEQLLFNYGDAYWKSFGVNPKLIDPWTYKLFTSPKPKKKTDK